MALIRKIAIYGKSGHGKVIADIAKLCEYDEIIFIDDDLNKNDVMSYEMFKEIYSDVEVVIGIGDNFTRKKIFEILSRDGISHTTLIHPSAILSPSVSIAEGSVVMANVVVNTDTQIGCGVILNTGCIIEHDNNIEDFVHISPGVALAGGVQVKKLSHIGIGSCAIQGVTIGSGSIVGAGSVIYKDVEQNTVIYDIRHKKVKEHKR